MSTAAAAATAAGSRALSVFFFCYVPFLVPHTHTHSIKPSKHSHVHAATEPSIYLYLKGSNKPNTISGNLTDRHTKYNLRIHSFDSIESQCDAREVNWLQNIIYSCARHRRRHHRMVSIEMKTSMSRKRRKWATIGHCVNFMTFGWLVKWWIFFCVWFSYALWIH